MCQPTSDSTAALADEASVALGRLFIDVQDENRGLWLVCALSPTIVSVADTVLAVRFSPIVG